MAKKSSNTPTQIIQSPKKPQSEFEEEDEEELEKLETEVKQMAKKSSNNPTQIIQSPKKPQSEFEEEDEGELEKLETEVKQMAKKILEYRTTLPDQLKTTVASLLSSQRPILPDFDSSSVPGPSRELSPDSEGQDKSTGAALLTEEDQKTAEKVHLLKEKISSNLSAMPVVLRRMKDCIVKIDKLDSYNGSIHPAFKRKKTS